MQLAMMEGVPVQPRKSKSQKSSRTSGAPGHGHRHSPYEGNQNHRARTSGEGKKRRDGKEGRVLGNLTNSPKRSRVSDRWEGESLTGIVMKAAQKDGNGSLETPERKSGAGAGVFDSPNGAEWFMAPRKGGIGKA